MYSVISKLSSSARSFAAGMALSALALSGCGGGGAPAGPKGAADDIKSARSALDDAHSAESQNRYDDAQARYESARKNIAAGKVNATSTEKARLNELSDEVNSGMASLDIKKLDYQNKQKKKKEKEEQEKQIAAMSAKTGDAKSGPSPDEIEAAAKKKAAEEEAKKKKEKEDNEKAMAAMNKSSTKKTHDEEPEDHGGAKTTAGKSGEGDVGGEKQADKPPAPKGPYKVYAQNPPNISIDAIQYKGEYIFCYFQLFNKSDADKRIGNVDSVFKDAGNGIICDRSDGTFQFDFFSKDCIDPTEQNNPKAALTGGSHVVPANGSIQLVSVGKNRRAKEVKKVSVTANFEDGGSASDSGPSQPPEPDKAVVPGLK
ncbi:MAG: hypothetical protein HY291_15225 [Planctomycetes bacterium]|nr:hypothetical protein [Planctomycetota bacterium]